MQSFRKIQKNEFSRDDVNTSLLSIWQKIEEIEKTQGEESPKINPIDILYPVGVIYTQYPEDDGQFLPEKEPSTLFKGTKWIERFAGESVFFRTLGEEAQEGRVNGIQKDQTKREEKDISHSHVLGGEKLRSFLDHTHKVGAFDVEGLQDGRLFAVNGNLSGRDYFTVQKSGQMWGYEAVSLKSENARYNSGYEEITTKTNSQHLTIGEGSETRPKNRLIKIWERIK